MSTKTCPQCHQEWETPFCPQCGLRLDTVLVPCPNCQAMVPPARHCQECGWKLTEEAVGDLTIWSDDRHEVTQARLIGPRGERRSIYFQYTGGTGEPGSRYWYAIMPERLAVGQWTVLIGNELRFAVEIFPNDTTEIDLIEDGYVGVKGHEDEDEEDEDDN